MTSLLIDVETASDIDIGKCGSFRYIEDDSFRLLLFGYSVDEAPAVVVDCTAGEKIPQDIVDAIYDPKVLKIAHNAAFEREVFRKVFHRYTPPEQWLDTMHLSAHCGLPLSLAQVCEALGFPEDKAKMSVGKKLIREFCCPVKPTKKFNMATHIMPDMDPENWEIFKQYCARDVDTELLVWQKLRRWTPDDTERKFWCLDQRINEKGIRADLTLAKNAMNFDARYKAELTDKAISITGLDNPSSVSQVKDWLMDQEGIEVPTLNKKAVADVVAQLQTDMAKEFMAIRNELSKTSTKKYDAFLRCACRDDHIKGCFQFFGGHTGRFAGRLVQLQNLAQNHLDDLDDAREIVKDGDYDFFRFMYPSTSDALSQLIRTTLVPEEGHQFLVADFSAIEARVAAWLTGEQWRLDAFASGKDIYCQSASQMFKVPVEKHGINGHLRQKGKVAELACIAEGQLVLTDSGLVPIEKVTTGMRLWDGVEWVSHKGVVKKGVKRVITYDGLTATEDHRVWVEGKQKPILFGDAARSGSRLLRAGHGRTELWVGNYYLCGKKMAARMVEAVRADRVSRMWSNSVDKSGKPSSWLEQRLPKLLQTKKNPTVAGQKTDRTETALRESERPPLQKLRSAWDYIRLHVRLRSRPLDRRKSRFAGECSATGLGSYRQRQGICAGKSTVGDKETEQREPQMQQDIFLGSEGLAVFEKHRFKKAARRDDAGANSGRCVDSRRGEAEELENHTRVVPVYDILDAGPRHRFTVSNTLVHNCGYGGGVNALRAFGADKLGMTEEDMAETVDKWREASPHIVSAWKSIENAMIRCITRKQISKDQVCGITFKWSGDILWMQLPSGRSMAYYQPRYEPSQRNNGRNAISYMGVQQQTRKWARIETFGGRLFENLVQAVARDLLRDAMMRMTAAEFDIRAHVHDECIVSEPLDGRTVKEMAELMGQTPDWAKGLPLRADGYACSSYRKD